MVVNVCNISTLSYVIVTVFISAYKKKPTEVGLT
jgi:hypothetical protein